MTRTPILASFVLLAVTACADSTPPPAAPHPLPPVATCDASGDVLFEIDHQLGTDPVTPQSSAVLYANGAWRSNDPSATTPTGCTTPAAMKMLEGYVADSSWTKQPKQGAICHAITLEQTVYKVRGRIVWVAAGCSGEELDAKSSDTLARLVDTMTMLTTGGPKKAYL